MTEDDYKRYKRLKHKPSTLSLAMTIIGIILSLYGIYIGYTKIQNDKYKGETQGMIYTVRCDEKNNKCNVVVKYKINNVNYTGDITTAYPSPFTINQDVVIHYNPNDFTDISVSTPSKTVGIAIMVVSVIALLNLLWYFYTQQRLLDVFKSMGY